MSGDSSTADLMNLDVLRRGMEEADKEIERLQAERDALAAKLAAAEARWGKLVEWIRGECRDWESRKHKGSRDAAHYSCAFGHILSEMEPPEQPDRAIADGARHQGAEHAAEVERLPDNGHTVGKPLKRQFEIGGPLGFSCHPCSNAVGEVEHGRHGDRV